MTIQDNIYGYFSRNPELRILFIFDEMDSMSELDTAEWRPEYRYIHFDGTWFSTKYRLEHEYCKEKVIIRFLQNSPLSPGYSDIFPMMDLLCANMEFKSNSDAAFMQQYHLPENATTFVRTHIIELQTAKYQNILLPFLNESAFSLDVGFRGLLSGYLGMTSLLSWHEIFIELITQDTEVRKKQTFYNLVQGQRDVLLALQDKAKAIFGVEIDLNAEYKMRKIAESLKYNALTQLLTLAPNDDYKVYKIINSVAIEQQNKILGATATLSQAKRTAFEKSFEHLSEHIDLNRIVGWYGIDADYFHMPHSLCYTILQNLISNDRLVSEPEKIVERLSLLSAKFENKPVPLSAVHYCHMLAAYYEKRKATGSLVLNTPQDYVSRYIDYYYQLDYYYRKALEALPHNSEIPILPALLSAKEKLDMDYATITNKINVEWSRCLLEKDGFDSITLPRQYDFYSKYRDESVKQVVIICDALRYEVATELMQELGKEKHMASLEAGLALLPTETKYCKPAMFPHNEMFLYVDSLGKMEMSVDNKILNSIEKRRTFLQSKVPNSDCINARELQQGSIQQYRELFKKSLVYVYYDFLDNIGHEGDRVSVTEACRRAVTEVAQLVKSLHATLNVANVIITSDHGFIYNDKSFETHEKIQVPSDNLERTQRYFITQSTEAIHGVAKFNLSKTSGVTNTEYVAVPMGTNRFSEQGGGYEFTHGGASLQEVIIPVIHSQIRKTNNKPPVNVVLVTRSSDLRIESSRIRFQLFQSESVSMDNRERTILVAIYDGNQPVTEKLTLNLNKTSSDANLRLFDVDLVLTQHTSSNILRLRVCDIDDELNAIIESPVTNNTLIERDF